MAVEEMDQRAIHLSNGRRTDKIKLSSEEKLLEAYRKDTVWEYVEETIQDTRTKYMKRKYRNSVNKYGEYMHQKGFI